MHLYFSNKVDLVQERSVVILMKSLRWNMLDKLDWIHMTNHTITWNHCVRIKFWLQKYIQLVLSWYYINVHIYKLNLGLNASKAKQNKPKLVVFSSLISHPIHFLIKTWSQKNLLYMVSQNYAHVYTNLIKTGADQYNNHLAVISTPSTEAIFSSILLSPFCLSFHYNLTFLLISSSLRSCPQINISFSANNAKEVSLSDVDS